MLAATALAQTTSEYTTNFYDTRIDVIAPDGERVSSFMAYNGNTVFSVFPMDDSFSIGLPTGWDSTAAPTLRFVAPGTEAYPLTLDVEPGKGIRASMEVLDEAYSPSTRAGADVLDLKCGVMVGITMDLPANCWPNLNITYEYTNPFNSYGVTVPISGLASGSYWQVTAYDQPEWRSGYVDYMKGNGNLKQDPEHPGRWTYTFFMPNEPVALTVGAVSPDDELLKSTLVNTMMQLNRQYSIFGGYWENGESALSLVYGDLLGQDNPSCYNFSYCSWLLNPASMENANYRMTHYAWFYPMHLIDCANMILDNLDRYANASESLKARVRGSMKLLRAHGYTRLLQYFAPRWEDSNEGAFPCAPLYTSWDTMESPLATMREILDLCYSDLNEAIQLLGTREWDDALVLPDSDVARGLLVRLALLRHDWETAYRMGKEVLDRSSYSLTTAWQCGQGFFSPVQSWMWGAQNEDLYYWSMQSWNAVNGTYPQNWMKGTMSGAMDRMLFKRAYANDENDVRLQRFYMPETSGMGSRNLKLFFQSEAVNPVDMAFNSIDNAIQTFVENNTPEGVYFDIPEYYKFYLGFQTKFWQSGDQYIYNNSDYVLFMRLEEILLSCAEAACEMGDDVEATQLLNRLLAERDCQLVQPGSGDLLERIRLERRVELWGEGHHWTDFKRWGMPIERTLWMEGNTESGNWPATVVNTFISPESANGWRFVIPRRALLVDPLINISEMGYANAIGYEDEPAQAPARGEKNGWHPANPAMPTVEMIEKPLRIER